MVELHTKNNTWQSWWGAHRGVHGTTYSVYFLNLLLWEGIRHGGTRVLDSRARLHRSHVACRARVPFYVYSTRYP